MAAMFGVTVPTIISHIQGFTDDGELDASTTRDFEVVRQEGRRQVRRQVTHYGMDVAFYVGYRVNSAEGRHETAHHIRPENVSVLLPGLDRP